MNKVPEMYMYKIESSLSFVWHYHGYSSPCDLLCKVICGTVSNTERQSGTWLTYLNPHPPSIAAIADGRWVRNSTLSVITLTVVGSGNTVSFVACTFRPRYICNNCLKGKIWKFLTYVHFWRPCNLRLDHHVLPSSSCECKFQERSNYTNIWVTIYK